MPSALAPIDSAAQIVEKTGTISVFFRQWLLALIARVQNAAYTLVTVTQTAQGAAIATTAARTTTSNGLYRVSYILRITQAATTSSSATVTLGWVESGIALSLSGAAVTGNTTTTVQTGTVTVRADALTDLTYAVAYASVGGTPMLFRIDVNVEQIS